MNIKACPPHNSGIIPPYMGGTPTPCPGHYVRPWPNPMPGPNDQDLTIDPPVFRDPCSGETNL